MCLMQRETACAEVCIRKMGGLLEETNKGGMEKMAEDRLRKLAETHHAG